MKNYILSTLYSFIMLIVITINGYSQCYIKYPLTATQRAGKAKEFLTPRAGWCGPKIIAVNFHFIQKTNGTRNFRANDDGYGGMYTGYDYAHKLIESLNADLLTNTKMQIPPNNNTPVNVKNYGFIVHGVYFYKNDSAWANPDPYISAMRSVANGSNANWQFDVFIISNDSANLYSAPTSPPNRKPGTGGYANSTDTIAGDKYTVCNEYVNYEFYKFNNYIDQWTPAIGTRLTLKEIFDRATSGQGLFNHEFNHLLTLEHTVMYPWGTPCPTVKDNGTGSVDSGCDDGCWDTPSAWYMRDTLNAPRHPANVSGTPKSEWEKWGSNNRMEYSGYNALTPKQIDRIHNSLEKSTKLRSYLICERVKANINLCAFNENVTAYYGNKVTISKNCSSSNQSIVKNKRYVKVIHSDVGNTEIFNGFEVKDGGYFEILSSCVCE